MTRIFEVIAGYIFACFAAAFVLAVASAPVPAVWPGMTDLPAWQAILQPVVVFWVSAATRIATVAAAPVLVGLLVAALTGVRSVLFYIVWAMVTAAALLYTAQRMMHGGETVLPGNLAGVALAAACGGFSYWFVAVRGRD